MDTKTEFKLFRDRSDPWGESLTLLFQIAAELWWRSECPAEWDYSPGACADDPRDSEDCYFGLIEKETTSDLINFGNSLERHVRLVAHCGHSY